MKDFNNSHEYVYVKLQLRSQILDQKSRSLLESIGVECLDQGGNYEAYGVVSSDTTMLDLISRLPCIMRAGLEAPPVGV